MSDTTRLVDLADALVKHPCVIVSIPLGVEQSLLGVVLARHMRQPGGLAYVVTMNVDEAKGTQTSDEKQTVHVVDYEVLLTPTLAGGTSLVNEVKDAVLIFDSVELMVSLIGAARVPELLKRNNKIVFIYNLLTPVSAITKISEVTPDVFTTTASFVDLGQDIRFEVKTVTMTSRQTQLYLEKAAKEQKEESEEVKKAYIKSVQFENLVYPPTEQTLLDSVAHPGRQKRIPHAQVFVDKYKASILQDAPKLHELAQQLYESKQRHVVFTRYAHHYGLEVIVGILQLYHLPVFTVSGAQSTKQRYAAVERFNAQKGPAVLVTTMALNYHAPTNVDQIHMVDGSLGNMDGLLNICYKYSNYFPVAGTRKGEEGKMPPILTVTYYLASLYGTSKEETGGTKLYRAEAARLTPQIDYWKAVTALAQPITLQGGRLAVPA
ncbi:Hypothetical protein POVN_LOCUS312 [uncultured virus]|nr:Hypothetical protein POVN_LOCUS312 [uncultured virus]